MANCLVPAPVHCVSHTAPNAAWVRRWILCFSCCVATLFAAPAWAANPQGQDSGQPPVAEPGFFQNLISQAAELAKQKPREPTGTVPEYLESLTYDDYMRIRFRDERALWYRQPGRFQVQFFHPGYLFRDPVRIHVLENGQEREVPFAAAQFDYGSLRFPESLSGLSFSGLRLLHPLNEPNKMDEIAVFQGSAYLRLLGKGQAFGVSARGLAIDTAEPSGEEFPRFTEFWLERPGPQAEQIKLYALLESPRAVGAYQFLLTPGLSTELETEASLFFRKEVKKLGLAPLTSMFFFGENRTRHVPDFRPEVHDSDGLLLRKKNQTWEWRPLVNPLKTHQITSFTNVAAFGLMQRDRNSDHYQDLQALYEARPSIWVEPDGSWGEGRVELVEIPSPEERNDNIVAYWVPQSAVAPGQEVRFRYRLSSFLSDSRLPPTKLLRVQATRLQTTGKERRTRLVVDFAGRSLAHTNGPISAKVEAAKGTLENIVTQPNPLLDGWRTFFDVKPDGDEPVELRVWLTQGEKLVSEIWCYRLFPE